MSNSPNNNNEKLTRRNFMKSSFIVTATLMLAACGLWPSLGTTTNKTEPAAKPGTDPATAKPTALEPTPACGADHHPSPALTEGPYFTPNSPERISLLEKGMAGIKLTLTGYVLSTDCLPVKHALVDFWQADDKGEYDNKGFILRGHQYTDDQGKYTLETVVPGLYPGRTRHIHVKVQAPNQKILTTQIFFPNEAGNAKDSIFNKALVMDIKDQADNSKSASLDFVLKLG
ncbi:dioxygenase family protein [Paenibacillus agricola]|uniref:Intradiol ring-cleavage dioxygenase n=1 Tax=Paenibacillus agricola TaxID=2716264 RepID=A0ABX0J934_9BACL|nr:intradiol ring-cleavage dioxygenase [Paenibacillus agricola]NHN32103.1 intradiol ring-cleavage dioxygenase [Paenibacillus agricola]